MSNVPSVQDLGQSVIRTSYQGGRIAVYRLSVVNSNTVEVLFEDMLNHLQTLAHGQHYQAIVDVFSHMAISLDEVVNYTQQASAIRPDIDCSIALIVRGRHHQFEALNRYFTSTMGQTPTSFRVFRSDREAIQWLGQAAT